MAFRFSTGLRNKLLGKTVNTVENGSFNADASGWSAIDATLAVVSGGYAGNCLQVTNTTSAKGYAYQAQVVKKGHRYMVELYHKNGTVAGRIKIGTSPNDGTFVNKSLDDSDWTRYLFLVEVPDTVNTIYITLQVDSAVQNDTSLFDEVKCIWEASSLKEIFKNSKLIIYTGSQPSSPDEAPLGTKLVEITTNASGEFDLEFDEASNGAIDKKPTDNWSGWAVASGTAGWFRLITNGDSEVYSEEDCRIDGAVGTANAELIMADTEITNGSIQTISVFRISIPETL